MSDTGVSAPIILVVGSINMDLVARCPRIPAPGETVLGSDFALHPGGKGANAATAAARLAVVGESGGGVVGKSGARVTIVAMLGVVGHDDHGRALLANLRERGVDTTYVRTVDTAPTGVALIAVAGNGDNSIVVAPGTNSTLRPANIEPVLDALNPSALLVQLEIPLDTVVGAATAARARGILVLLDPAPAPEDLPNELLAAVDIILPNEGELARLTGLPTQTTGEVARAAMALRARGPRTVVVKRGEKGALIVDTGELPGSGREVAAPRIDAVDTTGAGDCFDGALAIALVEDRPLDAAVAFATRAAALSCTRAGAQEAQPTRDEVDSRKSEVGSR